MAKNRTFHKRKNGKFFCLHDYKPTGKVGRDWDISHLSYGRVTCRKCGKTKLTLTKYCAYWPDELIDEKIKTY